MDRASAILAAVILATLGCTPPAEGKGGRANAGEEGDSALQDAAFESSDLYRESKPMSHTLYYQAR